MAHVVKLILLTFFAAIPAQASEKFECTEIERVSLSAEGSMRPIYQRPPLIFTRNLNKFSANGLFYNKNYDVKELTGHDFRAVATDDDRSDLFHFEQNVLVHTAIIESRSGHSIQSQIFRCTIID